MFKVLILTALPQEYTYLRKKTPRWLRLGSRSFKKFEFFLPDKEIVLIETGMGAGFAADALASALPGSKPDLVILAGFAGGLHHDLSVGNLCVAKRTFAVVPSGRAEQSFSFLWGEEFSRFFAKKCIQPVTVLTASAPPDKPGLAAGLGGSPAVVDMETADLARIALRERVPFICLRAISDSISDELGFDVAQITGKRGRVAPLKVLRTVIQRPITLRAFYRSWRRSKAAGRNLGGVLADILELPAAVIGKMAGEIRIERD